MCTSLGFLNASNFLVRLVLLYDMLARASLGKRAGRKLLSGADRRDVVSEVSCLQAGADKLTHALQSPAPQRYASPCPHHGRHRRGHTEWALTSAPGTIQALSNHPRWSYKLAVSGPVLSQISHPFPLHGALAAAAASKCTCR